MSDMNSSMKKVAIRSGKCVLALVAFGIFSTAAQAQQLYTPRTFRNAVAKGTRTLSGEPGPNYWENHGR